MFDSILLSSRSNLTRFPCIAGTAVSLFVLISTTASFKCQCRSGYDVNPFSGAYSVCSDSTQDPRRVGCVDNEEEVVVVVAEGEGSASVLTPRSGAVSAWEGWEGEVVEEREVSWF